MFNRRFWNRIGEAQNYHPREMITVLVLGAFVGWLFWPVIYYMAVEGGSLDYLLCTQFAKRMLTVGALSRPNFLYIGLVAIFHKAFPQVDFAVMGVFISEFFYLLLSAVLYLLIRRTLGEPSSVTRSCKYILATLSLMLVGPITIFTWAQRDFYLGYLYPANVYHNPSLILAKPFALLLFVWAVKIYNGRPQAQLKLKRHFFILGGLVVLSLLSKPNYVLCFAPALLIAAGYYQYYQKIAVNWRVLFLGILLPAGVTLTWQFYATYAWGNVTESEAGIIFAPLVVFAHYSTWLFPKFVLSILFPVVVYVVYAGKAAQHRELNLAWLSFLFGGFHSYFLAESGPRLYHGNFLWSGELTLFILFVISTLFLLEQSPAVTPVARSLHSWGRWLLCWSVFAGHLVSGLVWYGFQLRFL